MHNGRTARAFRYTILSALACLVSACGGKPPEATSGAALPEMPADHAALMEGAAARSPPLPPETVLATVGEHTVTAGDLDAAIAAMPSPDRLEYGTAENIRELVESLVDNRLMAAAARADGRDRDPVMRELSSAPVPGMSADQVLAGIWLESELGKVPLPSDADVARYYRENPAEFTEPARVRVTRVVAADESAARRLQGELARGATIEQLRALVPGTATSAEQLWLQDLPRQPEMTAVALGLKSREVSTVISAAEGFAVLRAEETAPARLRPLDEVHAGILARLEDGAAQQAMAGIRSRLRSGVQVSIDEARLASYLPPPVLPALPP